MYYARVAFFYKRFIFHFIFRSSAELWLGFFSFVLVLVEHLQDQFHLISHHSSVSHLVSSIIIFQFYGRFKLKFLLCFDLTMPKITINDDYRSKLMKLCFFLRSL
jgi:hypothetical protein